MLSVVNVIIRDVVVLSLSQDFFPTCCSPLCVNNCWHWQLRLNQLIFISLQALLTASSQPVCSDAI